MSDNKDDQPTLRLSADPNKPGADRLQQALDKVISENLDKLNELQAEAGAPLLADPGEGVPE